jgi:hypothetical protein
MIALASLGDNSPPAQAARTADEAARASAAVRISGNSNSTVRSQRVDTNVLSNARNMPVSPSSAMSTAFLANASAFPWISASTACETRFREPFGRPFGLPLCPGSKGRPRCFSAVLTADVEGSCALHRLTPKGSMVTGIDISICTYSHLTSAPEAGAKKSRGRNQ